MRTLFEWLGVAAGDDVMATARTISNEQVSDLGAVPPSGTGSRRAALATAPRRLAARARAALEGGPPESEDIDPLAFTFTFARAMRERDAEALNELTAPAFEFVLRGPGGDRTLRGDEGRTALVELAGDTFDRRYVNEWWGSAGPGPGEWWTSAPGKPFCTLFFSALRGDADRVDLAIGLLVEDELVRRALIVSAR